MPSIVAAICSFFWSLAGGRIDASADVVFLPMMQSAFTVHWP